MGGDIIYRSSTGNDPLFSVSQSCPGNIGSSLTHMMPSGSTPGEDRIGPQYTCGRNSRSLDQESQATLPEPESTTDGYHMSIQRLRNADPACYSMNNVQRDIMGGNYRNIEILGQNEAFHHRNTTFPEIDMLFSKDSAIFGGEMSQNFGIPSHGQRIMYQHLTTPLPWGFENQKGRGYPHDEIMSGLSLHRCAPRPDQSPGCEILENVPFSSLSAAKPLPEDHLIQALPGKPLWSRDALLVQESSRNSGKAPIIFKSSAQSLERTATSGKRYL